MGISQFWWTNCINILIEVRIFRFWVKSRVRRWLKNWIGKEIEDKEKKIDFGQSTFIFDGRLKKNVKVLLEKEKILLGIFWQRFFY